MKKNNDNKNENNKKKKWSTPDLTVLDIESNTHATTNGTGGDGPNSYS